MVNKTLLFFIYKKKNFYLGSCNTSTGVCTCSSGYSGSNCNTTTALTCPNNCSGKGTCNTATGGLYYYN